MKILVLDVPGLNLGFLGFYGNDWVATPNLDQLASQAVVFDRHYAGGVSDLATGCFRFPFPGESAPAPISPDVFWHAREEVDCHSIVTANGAAGWRGTVKQIRARVEARPKKDHSLVWVEMSSLAPPWHVADDMLEVYFDEDEEASPWTDPPTGLLGENSTADLLRLQDTYAAVVTFFDAQIGLLLEELEDSLDDWLVCFTSRLGLPLGEHGMVGYHRPWQHEELVHLPLVLRLPGGEQAGSRSAALTQAVDLVPTFLESFGLADTTGSLHGQSLWPLIRGDIADLRPYACSGTSLNGAMEWSVRTPEWALLLPLATPPGDVPREPQLYVKPDDRWEVNDVRQQNLEQVEGLEKTLRSFVAETRTTV